MLMGNFNIGLLQYDTIADSVTFLDSVYRSFITTHLKTLIGNIFPNNIEGDLISGNNTTTIPDHYAQFRLKKYIK